MNANDAGYLASLAVGAAVVLAWHGARYYLPVTALGRWLCGLRGHRQHAVDAYLERETGLYWRTCWCGQVDRRWSEPTGRQP